MLSQLPAAKLSDQVEADVDKVGDVLIYRIRLPDDERADPEEFFGGGPVVYVGVGEKTLWYSAGKGALENLKTAIQSGASSDSEGGKNTLVDAVAKLGPLTKVLHKLLGDKPDANWVKIRELAIDAFALGDDGASLMLERGDESQVTGKLDVGLGVLRFIGKLVANRSREDLDEG
jgi:hypothetical protein